MNILRHLYLSTAVRAPDEPAVAEPVIEPAPAADVSALIEGDQPAPAGPPAADEGDPPAPEADPPPPAKQPAMVSLRVLQQRVGEETTKRQAIERRATDAERRAADLQAIIERMQTERGTDPAAQPRTPSAPRADVTPERDFDAAVNAEADRRRFIDDTNSVLAAGKAKFPDFQETCSVLTALGVTNDDIVADLLAVDKTGAHEILDTLAKDPDRAASLAAMDSRRRIVELTRMSDTIKAAAAKPGAAVAETAPKPAAASRAPAPKPSLQPQAPAAVVDPTTPDGNDKMSDQQFERWYKEKYYKRG